MFYGKNLALLLLGLAGVVISTLTGARDYIPFLQFLCSDACRETSEILLFYVPLWMWGISFYLAVVALAFSRDEWLPWFVACAAGVEGALIWTMIRMHAACVFCVANAVVLVFLIAFCLRRRLIWQQSTLALLFLILFALWIPYENPAGVPSRVQTDESRAGILARVGGEPIYEQKIEVLLGNRLLDASREVYRLRKDKLDQLIVDMLLEKEARARGKETDKYIEEIAPPGGFTVTDAEIQAYLDQNRAKLKDWQGSMAELTERVKNYLQSQKRLQAINEHARTLQTKYPVEFYLTAPRPPEVKVDTEGAPSMGPQDAPVVIVEFSDYECPACRATHEVVQRVRAAYGDRIRWIYKDYPLKRHKHAFKAAEAAHCASAQEKFWEYQERLYTADRLDVDNLLKIAGETGLARDRIEQCLNESKFKKLVEKNHRDGVDLGIDRTPAFIINGRVFTGGPAFETFKNVIDEELKKSGRKE
ncbi:MAG: thioredoxin domain-containing protein [Desulfobacteraceae bacterium]|nr:thioredoxin domain-containing protein [Desulfobacteraceae bacterium]